VFLFACLLGMALAGRGFSCDVRFSLRLTGGMGCTSVGDLNGWRTTRSAVAAYGYNNQAAGGLKAIHLGLDGEADVLLHPNDRLALRFGAGCITVDGGKDCDRIAKSQGADYEELDSSAQAIPLRLGVSHFFPATKKMQAFISGGVGYYFAKVRDEIYIVENEGTAWRQTNQEAPAGGFGLHAGAGLEIRLGNRLAVVVEAGGRMARIDDFSGDLERSFGSGATEKRSGAMYFYGADKGGGRIVRTVEIWSEQPTGADQSDIRPFELDLTAIALRAGIRILL